MHPQLRDKLADTEGSLCGQVVDGRYLVKECVGRGGMGVVWRATDLKSNRQVALKTMHQIGVQDPIAWRRFLQEARVTGSIRSPHVVEILEVVPDCSHRGSALPFFVMELLNGQNLSEYLAVRDSIDAAELLWVMRQVASGLIVAHRLGIVHRDLKPSNIFLAIGSSGSPVVKLCDFGLAKLHTAAGAISTQSDISTKTGTVVGTPRYMAPEQLRHAGRPVPATDQWALALIAFRALSGEHYFSNVHNGAELILAIVHEQQQAPSSLSARIPKGFDAWFFRSCSREPGARYADVGEQLLALESVLGCTVLSPIIPLVLSGTWDSGSEGPSSSTPYEMQSRVSVGASKAPARRNWSSGIQNTTTLVACFLLAVGGTYLGQGFHQTHQLGEHRAPESSLGTITRSVEVATTSSAAVARAATPPVNGMSASRSPVGMLKEMRSGSVAPTRRANASSGQVHQRARPSSPVLLPTGASCSRSAECSDGLCIGETCL